ncbi:MAG: hypothetical protein M1833_006592 [Piccolia ochrophora]|nr:MAG: hypothetical protein M1833_006592 [Piccolia ochrophora]
MATAATVESAPELPQTTPAPPPAVKLDELSSSELSDLEDEDDIGEIEPDHYYEGGKVPVFKPSMEQFRSFKKFIGKIDKYGMKSGIVKVIPPKEWYACLCDTLRDSLPPLDEVVKTIKVKNPITQEIAGAQGTYRQANIEKQRSYNLPQWRQLCEASDHQPPARRGERRRNQEKNIRSGPRSTTTQSPTKIGSRRGPGRSKRSTKSVVESQPSDGHPNGLTETEGRPPTPTSPDTMGAGESHMVDDADESTVHTGTKKEEAVDQSDESPVKGKAEKAKTVSARRKYNRGAAADVIDEAAFKDFDYRITQDAEAEFTPERCEELEKNYWKSLTYNSPLYGADMPGSLFDDSTTSWNVAKLENLLDVLGQKVPGVNTAYLYLGMWKSTFAWHLEDVDLYSINYIHFGAPKQWYSISQEDARRFESAMRNVWPNDAKQCSQFLRHKTYLISPSLLQSQYNIRVNRLVHHEGEFVITFPYGYHSGYNLGYNCAESVNFATEAWLDYGRIAKKCECADDSVWVDVNEIERKLRGEETEFEETDDDLDDFDEDGEQHGAADLPTPPESVEGKPKARNRKRKRDADGGSKEKPKRLRVRIKLPSKEPCVLCPNDFPTEQLLPTEDGKKAHRTCAIYTPETYINSDDGTEKIYNVTNIDKARRELKCYFCRSKKGACFQCSATKCTRAYHPTCAAAAGVQVEMGEVPVFGEDGTEYIDIGIDFRCRYHRPKRPKVDDSDTLEDNNLVMRHALKLKFGDVVQMQYLRGEIFAGVVIENRTSEHALLVEVLPKRDRLEVQHKYVLALDPADSQLPIPSANAKPLPTHSAPKMNVIPSTNDPFCDPSAPQKWSEFHTASIDRNGAQVPVDMFTLERLWYYLGPSSTEYRAQFTEDPNLPRHNLKSVFLDTVKPADPPRPPRRRSNQVSVPASFPSTSNEHALNAAQASSRQRQHQQAPPPPQPQPRPEKPYEYKPKAEEQKPKGPTPITTTTNEPPSYPVSTTQYSANGTGSNIDSVSRQETKPAAQEPRPSSSYVPVAPMGSGSPYAFTNGTQQSSPPPINQMQPQRPQQAQPQALHRAPVANMGGGTQKAADTVQAVRPSPQPSTRSPHPTMEQSRPPSRASDSRMSPQAVPNLLNAYPLLHQRYQNRQTTPYKSPYATTDGSATPYVPDHTKLQDLHTLPQSQTNPMDQTNVHQFPTPSASNKMTYEAFFADMQSVATGVMPNPLRQHQQIDYGQLLAFPDFGDEKTDFSFNGTEGADYSGI